MPRQSRSRAAPASRPAAPRSAPAPAAQQSRGAHSATAPTGAAPQAPPVPAGAAAAPSREPGMMAQMAATAGSVAIGSTIGHGLSNMLFGGRSAEPAAEVPLPQAAPVQQQNAGISCDVQAKQFTQCLEKADLPSCTWYLEQLKACQAAAAPY